MAACVACIFAQQRDGWASAWAFFFAFVAADAERRAARIHHEADFLLGVTNVSRFGALGFKRPGDEGFPRPTGAGVPGFV